MSLKQQDAYRVYLNFSLLWSLSLTLAFTVNMIYLVTQMGLDPLQMVLVGTALELSAFMFEVPQGSSPIRSAAESRSSSARC